MFIGFIKLTTVTNIKSYNLINKHYGLIQLKKDYLYANILTTKPFGKYHLISDKCINPNYNTKQYLMDQTYILDPRIVEIEKISCNYLAEHMEVFKHCLAQIDFNNAINLIT